MRNLRFTNNIPNEYLNINKKNLFSKKSKKILEEIYKDIDNPKKTVNVLNENYAFNFKFDDLKKFKKFQTIALIGMGGSILGTEAINNFLEDNIKKKVYFFNNLDQTKVLKFKKKFKLNKVLFIIISKSGNTIETLSNLFSLNVIKKKPKNIIIITEKNNLLFNFAKKFKIFHIEHKPNIGGRYSVLSEVGIIPAYLMGINVFRLRGKLINFLKKNRFFLKRSSIMLSCLLTSKKFNNLIFLNYSPKMQKFLLWCQQLIAESLGKKEMGFLPVISSAPKDHHSLLQLYLDGPKDKFFFILSCKEKAKVKISAEQLNTKNILDKKDLFSIKEAQKNALIKNLKEQKIPYRELMINKINEEVLGELFAYFIMETIIVGKLTNINPFDQPAVEKVKIYTKKILS